MRNTFRGAFVSLFLLSSGYLSFGAVSVTPANTNLTADVAQNAASPAFTTIGNIVIAENVNNDFPVQGSSTLVLSAPAGWRFNAGVGTVARSSPSDFQGAPTIAVTSSSITVTFTVSGTSRTDTLTISGIQVQATNGAAIPSTGSILRSASSTSTITGITGATVFGTLSQSAGAAAQLAFTTQPGGGVNYGELLNPQPVVRRRTSSAISALLVSAPVASLPCRSAKVPAP